MNDAGKYLQTVNDSRTWSRKISIGVDDVHSVVMYPQEVNQILGIF